MYCLGEFNVEWLYQLFRDLPKRFTPFLGWIGELKQPSVLKADALAGLSVALVLIPQSMAYASLAGLPAQIGLYASFLPVIIAALLGSSRHLSTGPVAVVSLMSAAALQGLLGANPDTSTFITYSAFLAIIVGVIQLALGLLRLGVLVDFLSHPVIIGFTNAAALIIASSQLSKLFGLKIPEFNHQYEVVWYTIRSLGQSHWPTVAMAAFSLFTLLILRKYAPKLPNILITVVLATVLAQLAHYDEMGGKVVGKIAAGLPEFNLPLIDSNDLVQLIASGIVIALVGFVEAISIAKSIAAQTRYPLSANQELVGQGLANMVAGVFQGYAVSGSFSRTAVNYTSKARTGFSSVVAGSLVALTLLFFVDWLYYLPQATLAAVIMIAVLGLIKFEPLRHAWKVTYHDGVVGIVTFIMTLVVAPHLEYGIMTGVLLSLGLFLYRTMTPHFAEVSRHPDGSLRDIHRHNLISSETVGVYRFDGDLYFANSGYLEGKILNSVAQKPKMKVLVLDMESVDQVDSTGEEMLIRVSDHLKSLSIEFYLAREKLPVQKAFQRSGLIEHIGKGRFFRERTEAVCHAKEVLGDAIDITPILFHARPSSTLT